MRKFFYCFGIVAAILATTLVALAGYVGYACQEAKEESTAYSNVAIMAITTNWNMNALVARATPAFMQATDSGRLRLIFDRLDTLGPMVKAPQCGGTASVHYDLGKATTIFAAYACAATYGHNQATVRLWLTKVDGRWMINGFRVESPLFAAPAVPTVRKI